MGCSRRDQHTEMLGWRWVREREGRGGGVGVAKADGSEVET